MSNKHSLEEIQYQVEKAYPDMFHVSEGTECFASTMKSEVLGAHFQNFLREQFDLMGALETPWFLDYIAKMDGMTGDEIRENIENSNISQALILRPHRFREERRFFQTGKAVPN